MTTTMKIPLTMAIMDGMEVSVGETIFTIPLQNIRQNFKVSSSDILHDTVNGEIIKVMNNYYPVVRAKNIYSLPGGVDDVEDGILMWLDAGDTSYCLLVDELIGEQQIVVKPLPAYVKNFDIKRHGIMGCSILGDGSISGQTAWLYEPYMNSENVGLPVYSDESLEKAIDYAKAHGCQISVHAMGGRAIDRVVDRLYEEEDWTDGGVPYLRVEHLTEPTERAMERAAEKGFAFVTQPIFEYCEIETYRANMEQDRLEHIYPSRTMLDKGVKLAFSTDAPATSWAIPSEPFSNLKSAVTRVAYDGTDIGQSERVDIETAILLYTREAAEVSGFGGLGMLAPGYEADFAVLSEDIFSIPASRIDQVTVEETWMNGEQVYRAQ
jgi:predicted amidohydrolase YtcJ